MDKYLQSHENLKIISTAGCPVLGVPDCLTSFNEEIRTYIDTTREGDMPEANNCTRQKFIPEKTASPHPRFLGLAQSIRERRGKKVEIKVPLYQDENTQSSVPTESEPYPG